MKIDHKRIMADAVALQCKALAEQRGEAWDHTVHAAVRQHAEASLGGDTAAPPAHLPPWLSKFLKAVLAAALSAATEAI